MLSTSLRRAAWAPLSGISRSTQNVPSSVLGATRHVHQHVHVASFFSIHRPISVTTTVPPISTPEAFDAIFSKKLFKNEADDVIFTLSSTVQTMENSAPVMAESEDQFNQLHQSFTTDANGDLRMLDGAEAGMTVQEYTRRLRPFHPPPPPVPMDMQSSADALTEQETSTYSTVLTIREQRHADGRKTYEASTGPFVRSDMEDPEHGFTIDAPTGSTSGMTYIERVRHNRTMHAISTKRRRKIKMKKHKFKKLMRRTRTLRRKLDKA
ncbi:hypothetical protein PMG11_02509 [Penicillium brasilianum]|uniref:Small ribosomal subunit protein mS38 n=1 Tax=Penicillium brasilianum TaxID=104259 RepID=A0A0F7TIA5_PENBI|nr:hypothetical protein PMG11_02509 [Penicillium brasilianum]